jgi:hypothetical protein
MKNFKYAAPLALLAGLAFGNPVFATNPSNQIKKYPAVSISLHAQDICAYPDPSNVCVLNYSGVPVFVTIDQFNMFGLPVYNHTMQPFGFDIYYDSIDVQIDSFYGSQVYTIPNHGRFLEIDPPNKANPQQLVLK